MSPKRHLFHLAIPSRDLDASAKFYTALGCRLARRYDDRITIDFFGDQVVCHLAPEKTDVQPEMYPRHFGVTFIEKNDFLEVARVARANGLPFFSEMTTRFQGKREAHEMFFLIDPSNNLIEFKCYEDRAMVY